VARSGQARCMPRFRLSRHLFFSSPFHYPRHIYRKASILVLSDYNSNVAQLHDIMQLAQRGSCRRKHSGQ
jgi:hypothetical protein